VQALLETGGLLGVVDEDLLIGLALLPIALGIPGILQRLLVALPQLLVFRGVRLGDALQQLFHLSDGIIGLDSGEGNRLRQSIRQSRRCNMAHVSVQEKSP
jgi:hypothetical protein